MTVKQLVELMNNSKNKMLKPDQVQTMLKKELAVKNYLNIKDKKQLVENIINECILWDNGVFKFDDIEKYITFTMKTIEAYTNIKLSADIYDDYDLLCESKLLPMVINCFEDEYSAVEVLMSMKCNNILNDNSIEMQIGKFLNNLSGKLDDLTTVLGSKMNNFDINKLPIEEEDLNKFLAFIGAQK